MPHELRDGGEGARNAARQAIEGADGANERKWVDERVDEVG
jgi:hypothetical protein